MRIEKFQGRLTVYFEDPFWVGVFERIENGKLSATKVTFGAEPKDYEVQEFVSRHYYHLKFSPAIKTEVKDVKKNPKRAQRDAKKQTLEKGIGTKSQQALKLQHEAAIFFSIFSPIDDWKKVRITIWKLNIK